MPECVVFGCRNVPNPKEGIALHPISFYGKENPQKRKRQKKWVDFVQLKHVHWMPSKHSHVCSKHFRKEDFTIRFSGLMEDNARRRLRKYYIKKFVSSQRWTLLLLDQSLVHFSSASPLLPNLSPLHQYPYLLMSWIPNYKYHH